MLLHELMYIWLVGAPHQMTPLFEMFHHERNLEHFTREQNKYTNVDNIMKLAERAYGRGGGW